MKWILLGLALAAGTAAAQSWPAKPVRVVVTFSPGGSSDIVARLVAAPLQAELGQKLLDDGRPAWGGTIVGEE
jgi:tripartite-type tricarboxylate transporter receptor subunit TctC